MGNKNDFYLLLLKNNEFLQLYFKKSISIYFHLRKVIYTNYLKNITLFAKEFLIKKKRLL